MQILQQSVRVFERAQCTPKTPYGRKTLQVSVLWTTLLSGASQEYTRARAQDTQKFGTISNFGRRRVTVMGPII